MAAFDVSFLTSIHDPGNVEITMAYQNALEEAQRHAGVSAMLIQFAPTIKKIVDRLKPLVDQPIIRFPYNLPLANSQVIAAGASGIRLPDTDFVHALEWPFEVNAIKFSQDPSHTFRDWRVSIQDQTFNQIMMKSNTMVALLTNDNTGRWSLGFPWVVRPKGGGLIVSVDNLDATNPITVDINFEGFLMIPRA